MRTWFVVILFLSLCLCLCLSVSLCVSVSICLSVCLSVSLSVTHSLCLYYAMYKTEMKCPPNEGETVLLGTIVLEYIEIQKCYHMKNKI